MTGLKTNVQRFLKSADRARLYKTFEGVATLKAADETSDRIMTQQFMDASRTLTADPALYAEMNTLQRLAEITNTSKHDTVRLEGVATLGHVGQSLPEEFRAFAIEVLEGTLVGSVENNVYIRKAPEQNEEIRFEAVQRLLRMKNFTAIESAIKALPVDQSAAIREHIAKNLGEHISASKEALPQNNRIARALVGRFRGEGTTQRDENPAVRIAALKSYSKLCGTLGWDNREVFTVINDTTEDDEVLITATRILRDIAIENAAETQVIRRGILSLFGGGKEAREREALENEKAQRRREKVNEIVGELIEAFNTYKTSDFAMIETDEFQEKLARDPTVMQRVVSLSIKLALEDIGKAQSRYFDRYALPGPGAVKTASPQPV